VGAGGHLTLFFFSGAGLHAAKHEAALLSFPVCGVDAGSVVTCSFPCSGHAVPAPLLPLLTVPGYDPNTSDRSQSPPHLLCITAQNLLAVLPALTPALVVPACTTAESWGTT
jgi:hypothetical protein